MLLLPGRDCQNTPDWSERCISLAYPPEQVIKFGHSVEKEKMERHGENLQVAVGFMQNLMHLASHYCK